MRKEDEIIILNGAITALFEKGFRGYTEKIGLTGKQADVLMYLMFSDGGALEQKKLEEKFKVTKSAISTMLNTMERGGFVRREKIDGRTNAVYPTEKAEKLRDDICNAAEVRAEKFFGGFSEDDKDTLSALLKKLYGNISEEG